MLSTSGERTRHNQAFLDALDRLNPGQREAVDHIEGPVLVLAGPGTGKTHILAARIGRILLETDAAPHNILCLTFTNAGTRAMRERLLRFIGPEAHRVHIHTFHSFCQGVIQDNLEFFGQKDLQPLTDLERIETIRQLIDRLDVDHPLKRGRNNAYFFEPHLTTLFSQMKREAWTAKTVERRVAEYLADLPNRDEYIYKRAVKKKGVKKGDVKADKIREEAERFEKLIAAAKLFDTYQAALRSRGRYDFDDMILKVLKAFDSSPSLLRRYQEQYLYFLVDEFQDTNGAQYDLLVKLSEYWDVPNVFIVGDDDQSIYEFQGARIHNLTDFYQRYPEAVRLVVLKTSYRSTPPILEAAHALILHNQIRLVNELEGLGLDKKLMAAEPIPEDPPKPALLMYPDRLAEISDLAERVGKHIEEGVPPEAIAVIYAKHRQADRLIRLLQQKGIPFHRNKRLNLLQLPVIDQLRSMLAFLEKETRKPGSGDPHLFQILHYRFFGIHPLDIAEIAAIRKRSPREEKPILREILSGQAQSPSARLRKAEAVTSLSELLESWIAVRYELGLPALMERLINQSGMLAWILDHPERDKLLAAVKTFFDHLRSECARKPRLKLDQFLEQLELMEEHALELPMDFESGEKKGIELVTAHSAKGLEFDYVYLLDAVKDHWEPRSNRGFRFTLPDTLTYSGEEDAMEAARRLFYVSLTRARRGLFITCSRASASGTPLQPCRFIDELLEADSLRIEERKPGPEAVRDAQLLYLRESRPPAITPRISPEVEEMLTDFTLTITALNSFLRCPLSFYYDILLQVPSVSTEPHLYGSALHEALEQMFVEMMRTPQRLFPPLERLMLFFDGAMEKRRALFSPQAFARWQEMGRRDLKDYYAHHLQAWPHEVLVEKKVWNVDLDGVPLRGFIDRVDVLPQNRVRLVDYKSGTADKGKSKRNRPSDSRPEGGSHWRQMVFYKILFEQADFAGRQVETTLISYLEPQNGTFADKRIEVGSGDVEWMRETVRDTYNRIKAGDFFEGCGEERCAWCTFTRRHGEVITFSDPELESLDDGASRLL